MGANPLQSVEQMSVEAAEEALSKATTEYIRGIGEINIATFFNKNSSLDFTKWIDMFSQPAVRSEIKQAFGIGAPGISETTIDRFLVELETLGNTGNPIKYEDNPNYRALKGLVEKLLDYGKAYDASKQESEGFKLSMIGDGLKEFADKQIWEGLEVNPLGTLAKLGIAAVVIHQFWTKVMSPESKQWVWKGGMAAGALYVLNGIWPSMPFNKTGGSLVDMLYGKRAIKSPAFNWFFQSTGVEARDKIGGLMAVSEISVNKLVQLYRLGKGSRRIDIDSIIASTSDPDLIEKLRSVNTESVEKALFEAVSHLIALAGATTPSQFLAKFGGMTLRSAIISAYALREGLGGSSNMSEAERLAAKDAAEAENVTTSDEKLNAIFKDCGKDVHEHGLTAHDNRVWLNGLPFKYEITGDPINTIEFKAVDDSRNVATMKVGAGYSKSHLEGVLVSLQTVAEDYAKTAFADKAKTVKEFAGYEAKYDSTKKRYEVRDTVGGGGLTPPKALPNLGISRTSKIVLVVGFSPDGEVLLHEEGNSNVLDLSNLSVSLTKAALERNLRTNPMACEEIRMASELVVTEYDDVNQTVTAEISGTKVKFRYASSKYLLIQVDWSNPDNNEILKQFKKSIESQTSEILQDKLSNINDRLDDIAGFPADFVKEFQQLFKDKPTELATLYELSISKFDAEDPDLETKLNDMRTALLDDVRETADTIRDNYKKTIDESTGRTRVDVSGEDFRRDYIDILQGAGIVNTKYQTTVQNTLDAIFYSGQYSFEIAGQRLIKNSDYYRVKRKVVEFLYEHTGELGFKDPSSVTKDDEKFLEAVVAEALLGIQEAHDNSWAVPQGLISNITSADWFRDFSARIPESVKIAHIALVSEQEIGWDEMGKRVDERKRDLKYSPSPSKYTPAPSYVPGSAGSRPSAGPRPTPGNEIPLQVTAKPEEKEKLWSEYEGYIRNRFDALQYDVDSVVSAKHFMLFFGSDETKTRTMLTALVDVKEQEFVDLIEKDFDERHASWVYMTTQHGVPPRTVNVEKLMELVYKHPLDVSLDTTHNWLQQLAQSDPTKSNYLDVLAKFVSSEYNDKSGKDAFQLSADMIPPPDKELSGHVDALAELTDVLSRFIITQDPALKTEYGSKLATYKTNYPGPGTHYPLAKASTYDQAELMAGLNEMSLLSSKDEYVGQQKAYNYYLRHEIDNLISTTSDINDYEKAFEDTICNFRDFIANPRNAGWSLASLTAKADELKAGGMDLDEFKGKLARIGAILPAGYNIDTFMETRYSGDVRDISAQDCSISIRMMNLEERMRQENDFLKIKQKFWTGIKGMDSLGSGDVFDKYGQGMAALEQQLHTELIMNSKLTYDQRNDIFEITLMNYFLPSFAKVNSDPPQKPFDAATLQGYLAGRVGSPINMANFAARYKFTEYFK